MELRRRLRDHIAEYPEQLDNTWWRNGRARTATYCAGGTAICLDGGEWHNDDYVIARSDDNTALVETLPSGVGLIHAYERARRILGLSDDEAAMLFRDDYGPDDVLEVLDDLIGEAVTA